MTDRRAPDDDELQLGARPVPRWVYLVVGLAALGVVTGLLVANHSSDSGHKTQPAPSIQTQPLTGRPRVPPTQATAGEVLPTGDLAPLDVAAAGNETWLLRAGSISLYDVTTLRAGPRLISGIDFNPEDTTAQLVLDAAHARLWVLVTGAAATRAREFDAFTLRLMHSYTWPAVVSSATTLAGRLYVTSSHGFAVLAGRQLEVLRPELGPGDLVSDPHRSRLLFLSGVDTAIWTIVPSGSVQEARLPFDVYKGTLAVTAAGRIWLAGYSSPGPVLVRLDPATFRVTRRSSHVTGRVGPGAILLAAGRDHVFVQTGDNSPGLWCIDARTGAPDQYWPINPLAVAAGVRGAVTVAGADVIPLRLQGDCVSP